MYRTPFQIFYRKRPAHIPLDRPQPKALLTQTLSNLLEVPEKVLRIYAILRYNMEARLLKRGLERRQRLTTIGVNRVYAAIRPENQPSIRVAEKTGMRVESRFIKQYNGMDMEHICYVRDRHTTSEI